MVTSGAGPSSIACVGQSPISVQIRFWGWFGPRVRRLVQPPTTKTSKAQCLALPTTAIATWNTTYLGAAIDHRLPTHQPPPSIRRHQHNHTTPRPTLTPNRRPKPTLSVQMLDLPPSWPICRIHRWSLPKFTRRPNLTIHGDIFEMLVSLGRLTPQLWQSPTLTEAKSALWRQRSVASAPSAHPQPGQSVSVGTNYARVRLRRFA